MVDHGREQGYATPSRSKRSYKRSRLFLVVDTGTTTGCEPIRMTEQSEHVAVGMPSISMRPLEVISFLLLFALSFETVPLPIQAQIIPLTSVLALLFLPLTIMRIRTTPLFKMVIIFLL